VHGVRIGVTLHIGVRIGVTFSVHTGVNPGQIWGVGSTVHIIVKMMLK